MAGVMLNYMQPGFIGTAMPAGGQQQAPSGPAPISPEMQRQQIANQMINDALTGLGPEPPQHVYRGLRGAEVYNPTTDVIDHAEKPNKDTDIMLQIGDARPGSADAAPMVIRRREPNPAFDEYRAKREQVVQQVAQSPGFQMLTNPDYAAQQQKAEAEKERARLHSETQIKVQQLKLQSDQLEAAMKAQQRLTPEQSERIKAVHNYFSGIAGDPMLAMSYKGNLQTDYMGALQAEFGSTGQAPAPGGETPSTPGEPDAGPTTTAPAGPGAPTQLPLVNNDNFETKRNPDGTYTVFDRADNETYTIPAEKYAKTYQQLANWKE